MDEHVSDPDVRLTRALHHLDGFTRAIAHDLKAPLANVSSFAQLLPTVAPELGEQGAMMADRMVVNARRASRMVDDVLAYALQIGRAVELRPVSLDEVVQEVVDKLGEQIDESSSDVTWDALPDVVGDRESLVSLFRHVIDNAVRYRRPDAPVQVRIEARDPDDDGTVVIAIVDDGTGIAEDQRASVLDLGTRLVDRAGPIDGSGMGLSTALVIAENHGGSLEVGDEPPGGGTTVLIRLPSSAPGERAVAASGTP